MDKHSFLNDYSEGGHPAVLLALASSRASAEVGYGLDSICAEVEKALRRELNSETAQIHFMTGGTLANLASS
jgi:threonine aldolase